ncbi:uncharacterized protein EDB91DRAFT_1054841, partial [Suillus paluster]|uniref:uncharacterized protein n=1 Tax=Suillus paluster TaxID=48578 RepID=UPI001B87E2BF
LCMADSSLVPSTGIWTGTISWGPINIQTSFKVFPGGGSWRMLLGKPTGTSQCHLRIWHRLDPLTI